MDSAFAVFQTFVEQGADAALQQFRSSIKRKAAEFTPADEGRETLTEKQSKLQQAPHHLDYYFNYRFLSF